jgi:hypothetical protein
LSRDQHATSTERYWLLDLSNEEFAKTPDGYEKIVADIASDDPLPANSFDLVFPRIPATHTYDAKNHHNVQRILAPEAPAVHLFPTLFTSPFVVNRLTPERLTPLLVGFLQPKRDLDSKQGKFRA